jgi:two-component system NtrC family response regulator
MKDYSILIIDDEEAQRNILKGYLDKKGYRIFSASSGTEGIELIQKNMIDIVLSDYKMPDKTGLEVLETVKEINPEISFVILTAYGTIENAVKAMRLGAFDYIAKPVDLDELDLLLERIIENKNLKSEILLLKNQLKEKFKIDSFISHSPKMEEVLSIAARAADSKFTMQAQEKINRLLQLIFLHYRKHYWKVNYSDMKKERLLELIKIKKEDLRLRKAVQFFLMRLATFL